MADEFEYVDLADFWVENLEQVDYNLFDAEMWQPMTVHQSQNAARKVPFIMDGMRFIYQEGDDPEVGYLYTSQDNATQLIVRKHLDPPNLVLNLHADMVDGVIRIAANLLSGETMLHVQFSANKRIAAKQVIKRVREVGSQEYGLAMNNIKVIASARNKPLRVSDGLLWKPEGCRRKYVFKPLKRITGKTFVGFKILRQFFLPM